MSTASLEEIDARLKASNDRIKSLITRLDRTLRQLEPVSQKHPLSLDPFIDELTLLQKRFDEKKLIIVITGATSAGKSTLINALLHQDLIFTAPEHCTPCSVSVEISTEADQAFFTEGCWTEGCKQHDIAALSSRCDAKSSTASSKPLFAYLPRQHHNVLRIESLRLIDSPGLYEDVAEDSVDLEGDVLVFVVDFDVGVKWEELHKRLKENSSKAVFFVFNRCETVERFSRQRFLQGRQEKLKKAVGFLTDHEVFPDAAAAEESVFFLSARLALTARKFDRSLQALKAALGRSCTTSSTRQLLVLGAVEVGKTSLCNDLIGFPLLPESGEAPFVMLQACDTPAASSPTLQAVQSDIAALLSEPTEDVVHTTVAKPLLPEHSFLRQHGVVVVDSTPLEELPQPLPEALSPEMLVIVVSSLNQPRKIRRDIEKGLSLFKCASHFLVVTKLNELCSKSGKEEAMKMAEDIRRLWKVKDAREDSDDRLFFLERESLMEQYGAVFDEFEQHLVAAGRDRYEELKLKKMEESVAILTSDVQAKVQELMGKFDALEAALNAAPAGLQLEEATVIGSTRVDRFLRDVALPSRAAEADSIFDGFQTFLRTDLPHQLSLLTEAALAQLKNVDGTVHEAARKLAEKEIAECSDHVQLDSGILQQLRTAVPPPREKQVDAEALEESLRVQRNDLSQRLSDLERRKERKVTEQQHALKSGSERSSEIAALTERERSNQDLVANWRHQITGIQAEIDAVTAEVNKAEEEAESVRAEADKWAAAVAAADAEIEALTKTINRLDRPKSYLRNPLGTAIRCPQERRRRSAKEHEASDFRLKESAARTQLQALREQAEKMRRRKEEKEKKRSDLERKTELSEARTAEAAAQRSAEERKKAKADEEAAVAEGELSKINKELQGATEEAQDLYRRLQAAEGAAKVLRDQRQAMIEALPMALREALDAGSASETGAAVQRVQESLQKFATEMITELATTREEMQQALAS